MDFFIPSRFTLPINFTHSTGQCLVETALSHSKASVLKCWKYPGLSETDNCKQPVCVGVLGCHDGSLFLFHSLLPTSGAVAVPPTDRTHSRRRPSALDLTHVSPRSVSPSSLSPPPFHVTPRSRVVSGITTEQVEAQKTYVDFDDETGRLKRMLEGKALKEKLTTTMEGDVTRAPSELPSASHSERASLKGREHFKVEQPVPVSFSGSPFSPFTCRDLPSPQQKMSLVAHIVPNQGGAGHAIVAVAPLHDGGLFVALRESGDVRVFSTQDGACLAGAHVDDSPLQPLGGVRDKSQYHDTHLWRTLQVAEFEGTTLLVASATINANAANFDPEGDESSERSKVVIFELSVNRRSDIGPAQLIKLFQWSYNGPVGGITILEACHDFVRVLSISSNGTVSLETMARTSESYPASTQNSDPTVGSAQSNPFKAMTMHLLEKPQAPDKDEVGTAFNAVEEQAVGTLKLDGPLLGIRMRYNADEVKGLAWSHTSVKGFVCRGSVVHALFEQSLSDFIELDWIDSDLYCVIYHNRVVFYKLRAVDADGDPAPVDVTCLMQPSQQFSLDTGPFDALTIPFRGEAIFTRTSEGGQRKILRLSQSINKDGRAEAFIPCILAEVPALNQGMSLPSTLLPLEEDTFIQGYADGYIRRLNLSQLSRQSDVSSVQISDSCIDAKITSLHVVQNQRTKERFVVSGASDGSVAFWTIDSLALRARWILFTSPLSQVIRLPIERAGPLHGCLLCIAQDGTIAVIVLDDFQFICMIPGSAVPLTRVCLAETSLLLVYKDKRARLWDTQTKVFWRSLTQDKVEELLSQGGWTEQFLRRQDDGRTTFNVCDDYEVPDAASTITLDLERFLSDSVTVIRTISTNKDQVKAVHSKLDQLRLVLSFLLTPGLNNGVDDICQMGLCISTSSATLGFSSIDTSTLYPLKSSRDAWCISGDISAARLVAIAAVLRALGLFDEYTESVKAVTSFYTTSLPDCVGQGFQAPNLCFLALLWLKFSELRISCRSVFDAFATRLSDDEANFLMERWQDHLPSLQGNANKESTSSALALYLCGYIAVEKYSVVSSEVLRTISKSLALYLQEDRSQYRVLAIDLCSKGFHVWQHYIDAMEILRSLFSLATSSRKDSIDLQNVAAQARTAVLQIASSNSPLFMTTLGLDILNPPNLDHRRSVLQIVAFLIRKRPLVLHSNLPKLMEAVVKSLDPNSTADRDAVLDIATEVIGQVVKTFPNVDFHGGSQRLAVGSHEGAIIMYDLKTATRLYVLEGHKKRLSSCSFSPDGRRLVTVSLDEGLLHVWKVGSSFVSFFTPGAPPRQGHGGSQPYKTLNFHFGDIVEYSDSLDSTKFEWVGDRNVRVKIGPNTLFFST